MEVIRKKTVEESKVETVHIIRPTDLNSAGRLYGGALMSWIDEVAALVAKRHSQMNVTTASVDNLRFLRGAFMKDVVVIQGKLVYVGTTSMEIKVETCGASEWGERACKSCVSHLCRTGRGRKACQSAGIDP